MLRALNTTNPFLFTDAELYELKFFPSYSSLSGIESALFTTVCQTPHGLDVDVLVVLVVEVLVVDMLVV